MPFRLCILSIISLVTFQVGASARTMLEPRVGMEALLLNCMLYDPACMKVPISTLQPLSPIADAAHDAVAETSRDVLTDPETTGSVKSPDAQ